MKASGALSQAERISDLQVSRGTVVWATAYAQRAKTCCRTRKGLVVSTIRAEEALESAAQQARQSYWPGLCFQLSRRGDHHAEGLHLAFRLGFKVCSRLCCVYPVEGSNARIPATHFDPKLSAKDSFQAGMETLLGCRGISGLQVLARPLER